MIYTALHNTFILVIVIGLILEVLMTNLSYTAISFGGLVGLVCTRLQLPMETILITSFITTILFYFLFNAVGLKTAK